MNETDTVKSDGKERKNENNNQKYGECVISVRSAHFMNMSLFAQISILYACFRRMIYSA